MKTLLTLLSMLAGVLLAAQKNPSSQYFSICTGAVMDNYQSFGGRLFLEYSKEISPRWSYGISLDQTRHIMNVGQDFPRYAPTNINAASFNYYFRINLIKQSVYWTAGVGAGLLHLYWDDHDRLGLAANVSWLLHIRLSENISIQGAPFLIIPPFLVGRFYYTSIGLGGGVNYYTGALPLGVKWRF